MTATGNVLVLHEGRFGAAAAAHIAAGAGARSARLLPLLGEFEQAVAGVGFLVTALWRRHPEAVDVVDTVCARLRIPWTSVTLEGRWLVIGPLVVPGHGPCHACYRKRWWTHEPHPDREQALDDVYDSDPSAGSAGYPPSAVRVAVAGVFLDRADLAAASGRVRSLDLLHGAFEETRVVRVHGCGRCGEGHYGGERYVHHLRAALEDGVL